MNTLRTWDAYIPRKQRWRGQNGAHLGPVGPILAPWTLLSGYCLYRRIGYITGSVNGLLSLDQSHKSHDAPVQCPTMHCSEQKCAHFCTEWCIEGSGISALWDLWIWSTAPLEITFIELWIKVGKFSVKLNAFKNVVCKIVAILFLNVLTPFFQKISRCGGFLQPFSSSKLLLSYNVSSWNWVRSYPMNC